MANLDENTKKIPYDYPDYIYNFPQMKDKELSDFSLNIISILPEFMKFDKTENTIIIKLGD